MRLIDADELIKAIEQSRNNNPHEDCRIKRIHDIEHNHFIKMVSEQRTAFNKEKVIEELKSWEKASHDAGIQSTYAELDNKASGYYQESRAYHRAIEIVEKGGIE